MRSSSLAAEGLDASPVGEILVERSIAGWKEYELEVMRDNADNCVVVCSIENLDPMGVHTGDSITVAPAQTLTDVEYQAMRDDAFACLRRVGVETGGSNVQFAVDPADGRRLVIEMNPRVSRSSALASKATGFPIAKIAARLAVGYRLDEITNDITRATPASFEPTIDYVVTKIPRWAFEKLPGAEGRLGTRMQSVGEVMAIGRTFCESLQKAVRSLEQGRTGLNGDPAEADTDALDDAAVLDRAAVPDPGPAVPGRVGPAAGARGRRFGRRRRRRPDRHRSVVPPPDRADQRGAAGHRSAAARPTFGRRHRRRRDRPTSDGPNAVPPGEAARVLRRPAGVPARCRHRASGRAGGAGGPAGRRRRPDVQDGRHVRGRVRGVHAVLLRHLRGRGRGPPVRQGTGRHPRVRAEPDRAGDRVRLLLRPREHGAAGGRLRDGHDQLQPRDRVDRLRHVRPAVLRAADRGGRRQRARRGGTSRRPDQGCHRGARRPDAAQVGRLAADRARARDEPGVDRPGRGP